MDFKKQLHTAFSLFVGKHEQRYNLNHPFKQKGFYFATDAHAIMWVPDTIDLGYEEQDKPDCLSVIPEAGHSTYTLNINSLEQEIKKITPLVFETEECFNCEGEGEMTCDLHYTHECRRCDGEGRISLNNNKKVLDVSSKYILNGKYFSYKQLNRLIQACKILGFDVIHSVSTFKENKTMFIAPHDVKFLFMQNFFDEEENYLTLNV